MSNCQTLYGTSIATQTIQNVVTEINTFTAAGSTSVGSSIAEIVTITAGDGTESASTRYDTFTQTVPGDVSEQTQVYTEAGIVASTSIFPTATNCQPVSIPSAAPSTSSLVPSSTSRPLSSTSASPSMTTSLRSASSTTTASSVQRDPTSRARSEEVSYVTSIIIVTAPDGSQSTSSSVMPVLNQDDSTPSSSHSSRVGAIAGGTIGGILGLVILLLLLLGCCKGKGPFASCRPTDSGISEDDWKPAPHQTEKYTDEDDDGDEGVRGASGIIAPVQFERRRSTMPTRRISGMSQASSRPLSMAHSDYSGPEYHGLSLGQPSIPKFTPLHPSAHLATNRRSMPILSNEAMMPPLQHRMSLPLGFQSLPHQNSRNRPMVNRRMSTPTLHNRPSLSYSTNSLNRPARPVLQRLNTSHGTTTSISTLESSLSSSGPVTPAASASLDHNRRYDLHIVGEEDDLPYLRESAGSPSGRELQGYKLHLVTDLDQDVQEEQQMLDFHRKLQQQPLEMNVGRTMEMSNGVICV